MVVKNKILLVTTFFTTVPLYSMMHGVAYNRDEIEAIDYKLKSIDFSDYKTESSQETQNKYVENEWKSSMEAIAALVNDKDLSSLKPLFSKLKEYGDEVFNASKVMYGLRNGLMKDKIKLVDGIKKKQSDIKKFLLGQKLKAAFSFGKKESQYKKLKQLLMDTFETLQSKVEQLKRDVEIKKQ